MAKTEAHAFTMLPLNGENLEYKDLIDLIDSLLASCGYQLGSKQLDPPTIEDFMLIDGLTVEDYYLFVSPPKEASTRTNHAELWRNCTKEAAALSLEKMTSFSVCDGRRAVIKRMRDEVDDDAMEDAPASKRRRLVGPEFTQVGASAAVDKVRLLMEGSVGQKVGQRVAGQKAAQKVGQKVAGKSAAARTDAGKPAAGKAGKTTIKKVTWNSIEAPTRTFRLPQDRYM